MICGLKRLKDSNYEFLLCLSELSFDALMSVTKSVINIIKEKNIFLIFKFFLQFRFRI
jgi:hypothetical protein